MSPTRQRLIQVVNHLPTTAGACDHQSAIMQQATEQGLADIDTFYFAQRDI